MKDIQSLINKKAEVEATASVDIASSEFISKMKVELCSEYIVLKTANSMDFRYNNESGEVKCNLINLIRNIAEQQKPKIVEKAQEKASREFFHKIEDMQAELDHLLNIQE